MKDIIGDWIAEISLKDNGALFHKDTKDEYPTLVNYGDLRKLIKLSEQAQSGCADCCTEGEVQPDLLAKIEKKFRENHEYYETHYKGKIASTFMIPTDIALILVKNVLDSQQTV